MLFSQEEKGAKASKGKSAVIINYELAKFTDVLSGLHAGISEYALIDGFYEEYELALYEYFEHRGVFLEEEEETEDYFQDEEEIDRFIGWYTYYFITDGHDKTFPALYRRLHKYELLPFEEEILKSYEDSYLNLYEVQNVEPGTGFGLKDLLGGRIHWVQDAFISRMLCKWDVIYAGLITGRGFTFLGGFEPIVIPPRLRESIQKKILEMYEDQRKEYAGLEEFLKIKSASIVALIDEILEEDFEEPPLNNDGDLLCLTTLYYRIADPDSLMEKINATSFLSGQSGPPTEKSSFLQRTYTWIRHVKKDLKVYDTPPLGVLKVEKHRFTAECNSMERAKKLRAILENTFGDLIQYKTMICEDPEIRIPLWSDFGRESEIGTPGGYENWLDEEIPALGGMTPREAALTPGRRERLFDLLKELENENERAVRLGLKDGRSPHFPVDKILKELGL